MAKDKFKNPKFSYVELGYTWAKNEINDGGFVINWAAESIGFGQLTFYLKDNKLHCETENMSKKFVNKTLLHLLDNNINYIDI